MKILFYNLGYSRGHVGSLADYVLKSGRFFYQSRDSQKRVLDKIKYIIDKESPDVFVYAEISTGSFRNSDFNQHNYLLGQSKKDSVIDSVISKYGESVLTAVPFHKGNSNGVISYVPTTIKEYFLTKSRKKLVFKIETEDVTIFTVHLPLVSTDRKAQLLELSEMVNQCDGDVVICGDFNIMDGIDELGALKEKTSLKIAGEGEYTFPSYKPKRMLDVFMYRFEDKGIIPEVRVLPEQMSDHLSIVLEW